MPRRGGCAGRDEVLRLRVVDKIERWRGKWALVTGASSGIGQAIAEVLAAGGSNLVLTARRKQRLMHLRRRLRTANGVRIELVTADIANPDGPREIFRFTESREITVDLLVNNAGLGSYGEFRKSDLRRELGMVQVNCSAVAHLTRLYLPGMVERRSGGILIVSSTAAFQAVPYMAVYAATKGFDLLFAEALAREVEGFGVRVCALCPGPTASEFQSVAGVPESLAFGLEPAAQVAAVGLKALAAGEHSVISGVANWLGVEFQRLAPRRMITSAAEIIFRPQR